MAGDLDTVVGSILLSLVLTRLPWYPNKREEDEESKNTLVIPCLNFPREELEYKIEVLHHLDKYNIKKK